MPAGGLARRTPLKALRVQARTTYRMPPHQPTVIPERAVKGGGVLLEFSLQAVHCVVFEQIASRRHAEA